MKKKKITSDDLKVNLEKIGKATHITGDSQRTLGNTYDNKTTDAEGNISCNCYTGGATHDHCKTIMNCDTIVTCESCETCKTCGPTWNPSLNVGTICSSEGNCTSNNCNQTEETDCVATISAGAVCCEFTQANGCQNTVDNCPQKPSVHVCPATQQATCEAKTCQPVESLPNCDSSLITCFCGGPSVSICPTPNPNDDK